MKAKLRWTDVDYWERAREIYVDRASSGMPDLLEAEHTRVFKKVLLKMRNRDEADDILQEYAIGLFRGRQGFDPHRSLRPYFERILKNKFIDYWRKNPGRAFSDLLDSNGQVEGDQLDKLLEEEAIKKWDAAVMTLGADDRNLYDLYIRGLSKEEIARILGITRNALYQRTFRLKRKLRTLTS